MSSQGENVMESDKVQKNTAICKAIAAAGLIVIDAAEYQNMLLLIGKKDVEIQALEYRITTLMRG